MDEFQGYLEPRGVRILDSNNVFIKYVLNRDQAVPSESSSNNIYIYIHNI